MTSAIPIDEAARLLGVGSDDVIFLGACGVLEKRKDGVSGASLDRFAFEASEAGASVEHAVRQLRTEWDRALIERGPSSSRRVFGAVPLGEHPDGTAVFAVESALDRIVARNLHVLGGGRIRQLIVDPALLARWGVQADLLDEIPEDVIARVPAAVAREKKLLPVEVRGSVLIVAAAAPLGVAQLDTLRHQLGGEIDSIVVPEEALHEAIERSYPADGPAAEPTRLRIGEILIQMGYATPNERDAALEEQKNDPRKKLGRILIEMKACDEEHVAKAIAHQANLRYAQLDKFDIPPDVIELVPRECAVKERIVPLKMGKRALIVAVASPLGFIELDDLRFRLGHEVSCVIASESQITEALGRYYGSVSADEIECKMMELSASAEISVRREDIANLECVSEPLGFRPEPEKKQRLELKESDAKDIPYTMVPATPSKYANFEETKSELGVDEEELKKLVSQGELRGFRDGLDMKFKREEVENLKAGRETEPTIILTDSDSEMGIAEDHDELVLEDSTSDTVINLGNIMNPGATLAGKGTASRKSGAKSDDGSEIVFDTTEEQYTVAPHDSDPEASISTVEIPTIEPMSFGGGVVRGFDPFGPPSVSKDMGIVETESAARLVEVGSDESMETEAFELMEESGEDDDTGLFRPARSITAEKSDDRPRPATTRAPMPFAAAKVPPPVNRPAPAAQATVASRPPTGAPMPIGAISPMKRMAPMAPPPPPPMPPMAMPVSAARSGGGMFQALGALASAAASGVEELSKLRQQEAQKKPDAKPKPNDDDEPETFERKATVRYYSQMYARQNYPLLVVVSKRAIQKIVKQHVAQVESKKSFKIRRGNPFVTVRPILPGCLCVPPEITMNVKPKVAEAKFWVTPTAEGVLEEARVEVLYEGKVVSTIEVPTRVTTQTLAKLTGSAAFFATSAGPFFEAFGISVKKESASLLADVLAHMAGGSYRYGLAGILAFFALVFFLKRRPKSGPETEGFFDWGVEEEVEGDPLVKAVKAKLVVLGPEGRDVVDLIHSSTLVGSAQTAHVRVKGARSLAEVACELRYDDTFVLRARTGGVKVNGEDVPEGTERKLGRDAVIDLDSGRVTLWLLDLRQDPSVDEKRDAILDGLVRARPSFEKELRALWKRLGAEPVRAALLEAIRDTFADPHGWRRVRETLKI